MHTPLRRMNFKGIDADHPEPKEIYEIFCFDIDNLFSVCHSLRYPII